MCFVSRVYCFAQDVWNSLNYPLPPSGFSNSSVFLNLHFLVEEAKKPAADPSKHRSFPWILWHLWKARNTILFERCKLSTETIKSKALEDTEIWFQANQPVVTERPRSDTSTWMKPPFGTLKCNVGSSWYNDQQLSGAAWILRNHNVNIRRYESMYTIAEHKGLTGRKRIWVSMVHGGSSRRFVGLRDEVHGGGGEKRRVVRDPAKVWCPRRRRREVVKNGGGRDVSTSKSK
ncbi:hypothetical protein DY000_02037832 [Brassica cretica]|uniref:Uncharacterized protein n=1 Tax=Brassica cretica TaxID=69181 RepID=A0ABQ7B4P9_BRACR|nr:hypothetical protein DY000_02037832 [Brassica cretica]